MESKDIPQIPLSKEDGEEHVYTELLYHSSFEQHVPSSILLGEVKVEENGIKKEMPFFFKETGEEHIYNESLYHSSTEQPTLSSCLLDDVKVEKNIKKERPFLICSSTSDNPIASQSMVDDLVSGNVDLENNIAGYPIQNRDLFSNSLMQKISCNTDKDDNILNTVKKTHHNDKERTGIEEEQIFEIKSGKLIPKLMLCRIDCTTHDVSNNLTNCSCVRRNNEKPPECHDDDTKSPEKLNKFKQELNPSVSTESDTTCLPHSTFKLSSSDTGEIDLKVEHFSQIPVSREIREEEICKESTNHSNSEFFFSCHKASFKDEKFSIKREAPFLNCSSTSDHPIVIQSKVDDLVSGNVDLENDIASDPIQDQNHFSNGLVKKQYIKINEDKLPKKDEESIKSENKQSLQVESGKWFPKDSFKRIDGKSNNISCEVRSTIKRHQNSFICKECGKSFDCKGKLQTHMRMHTGEKPFKCMECEKGFRHRSALQTHMKTHTGKSSIKCMECDKWLSRRSDLQRHMKTHNGEKPFKCMECDKCYSRREGLQAHMRTHRGEKPFKCMNCDKCFNLRSDLKGHIRTHTGEKPFKCVECDKCFGHRSDRQRHMQTHTGDKPFKCMECDKCFGRGSNLQKHMKTHRGEKPFKCMECDKCFNQRAHLQTHMITHTGEKPFKCMECDKCFGRRSDLQKHMRTHTGEKPFKCMECDRCFGRRSYLQNHMKTHKRETIQMY